MALAITQGGSARNNEALVQRMLLMALLNDLSGAASPSRFWVLRARRRPFVLLLPEVGQEGAPIRRLLDTYADISRTEPAAPLMVLGAVAGEAPSYAQPVAADPRSLTGLADRVRALYTRRSASAVYLVPLTDGRVRTALESGRPGLLGCLRPHLAGHPPQVPAERRRLRPGVAGGQERDDVAGVRRAARLAAAPEQPHDVGPAGQDTPPARRQP
ncbi:hypothetical protein [Streptomyces sp. NPDC097981]|uniref:hypothetical protein n=1 Tax=Streptomyces sp. NPDC097981 TaxID=3155428 RepID=UPI0033194060